MFKNPIYNFLLSLFLVVITAIWGSYFNSFAMDGYYEKIQRSALTPPNYVFPIVWTVLYALMVISLDLLLNIELKKSRHAVELFVFNLFLHILWTYAFFYHGYFLAGLMILIMLDVLTAVLIEEAYKLQKTAGILLLPLGAWIIFATYLNWVIYDLNGAVYNM